MLVMRFLTNKQAFKAPSWYLTQTFWWKRFKKHGKMWKKGKNTNYAQMQNFIQIPHKMKWEICTLPF